jgi:hypothetical protein
MRLNKFLILLLFVSNVWAQTTTATLGPVQTNGLHRIYLPPGIRSYSELSLADFRIYDADGNQVPYQIPSATYNGVQSQFVPYKIISREVVPKQKTAIVVEMPAGERNDVTLKIANAEVTKKFSISGSDDGQRWFGLVNQRELSEITNPSSTDEYKIIFVPRNKYRYIRFDIDDKKTLPLNILEIGTIELSGAGQPRLETIKPKITLEQLAEHKVTLVHVVFDHAQLISEFQFDIGAPNHYNRDVDMFVQVPYRYKKKDGIREQNIQSFTLSSQQTNHFFEPFFEKDFYFRIDNRDNPPLEIKNIIFKQKLQWVAADLKSGVRYTIKTGNPKMTAPEYDLAFSEAKLHGELPEAKITAITHAASASGNGTVVKSVWQQPWFLWLCILIAALAILYFTTSLVKDMKRE